MYCARRVEGANRLLHEIRRHIPLSARRIRFPVVSVWFPFKSAHNSLTSRPSRSKDSRLCVARKRAPVKSKQRQLLVSRFLSEIYTKQGRKTHGTVPQRHLLVTRRHPRRRQVIAHAICVDGAQVVIGHLCVRLTCLSLGNIVSQSEKGVERVSFMCDIPSSRRMCHLLSIRLPCKGNEQESANSVKEFACFLGRI